MDYTFETLICTEIYFLIRRHMKARKFTKYNNIIVPEADIELKYYQK